ncbi:Diacylglycerol kinase [Sesamum angolense]|uniref:Diacylglycerol kinase n=1 Tax=Sesamum angolense TaxID=2727404 RepID=A0AAE1WG56_9LAMI|nr:Diacylglycerol kinase [Sesamum angolense]
MNSPDAPCWVSGSGRSAVIDSIRGCTISGVRIPKEDLKKKITCPDYIRLAMTEAIQGKDVDAATVVQFYEVAHAEGAEPAEPPEFPLIVFINSKSGGRHGPELKARLQELMGEEQVAGGDGTVGWVLGCLGELNQQDRLPVPPTGIIPLGTGNDLSRSFGWGGSFPFNWKSAIKRSLDKVARSPIAHLDSWHLLISMPAGEELEIPYSIKETEETPLDMELEVEGELPDEVSCYQGVFYNYFSIGMDAQVAYGFHHLRNEKPYLAQGPIANKDVKCLNFREDEDDAFFSFNLSSRWMLVIIYSGYSCKQGWFFTPCSSDPGLRSLKNILRIYAKKVNSSTWEQIPVPSSVRSVVALNLPSYASGRNPWGNLKPEYLEKRGFVEAQADDGLLEVFGFKQGWHASMVMVELINAKHITQASAIRFELRGGEWTEAYMQVDGEPWKQPMNREVSTFVEIKRVPHRSVMVKGSE